MSANQLNHLAIIPDGNSRWAKANGRVPYDGYRAGIKRGLELTRYVRSLGIHTTTWWGLSTENWRSRPKAEMDFLARLFVKALDDWLHEAQNDDVRVVHLGRRDRLPKKFLQKLAETEAATINNNTYVLNLAFDYGGQDEIMRAVERQQAAGATGPLDDYLDTAGQPHPNPDFIIRTSGEVRLSGFMPWQAAYAEYYFEPVFYPDFTRAKLDTAIAEFYQRQRRFGGGH